MPAAVRSGTLYLQSGKGWYCGWFTVDKPGWQQVQLRRSDFVTEGNPTGWHDIQTVRLSIWPSDQAPRIAAAPVHIAVDMLAAHAASIVVVHDRAAGTEDIRIAAEQVRLTVEMLESVGADVCVVNQSDMHHGGLAHAKVAILPYNPSLLDRDADALARYVRDGGRVVLAYILPEAMQQPMGIRDVGWLRAEPSDRFTSMTIDAQALPGAPETLLQNSWNIRRFKPTDGGADVVGWWVDAQGRRTDEPAVSIAPGGLFIGHLLTPLDTAAKQQFILAAIAKLQPQIGNDLVMGALRRALGAGHEGSIPRIRQQVQQHLGKLPEKRLAGAMINLGQAERQLGALQLRFERSEHPLAGAALEAIQSARQLVDEANWMGQPTWHPPRRAVWCHAAEGVEGWDWDRAMAHLADHQVNTIFVNALWAGRAWYPNEVMPAAEGVSEAHDPLAEAIAAGRRHGVQVHLWMVVTNLERAPDTLVKQMEQENRLVVDAQGKAMRWVDPSHPRNVDWLCRAVQDVVRRYDLSGLHLDYIRYPQSNTGYSTAARKRFTGETGVTLTSWPEDVVRGAHREAFTNWRAHQVTNLVGAISRTARLAKPQIIVSAAVFSRYPQCRSSVGQDWPTWLSSGSVDFICPMNYTTDTAQFREWLATQLEQAGDARKVIPGIGATAATGTLSPTQVIEQLRAAEQLNAPGFVLFNYERYLADHVLPALRMGMLADE
jgi:uncharacterized lipoprotein YddW (UPF0748 family)